jgi:hypothetical protein
MPVTVFECLSLEEDESMTAELLPLAEDQIRVTTGLFSLPPEDV